MTVVKREGCEDQYWFHRHPELPSEYLFLNSAECHLVYTRPQPAAQWVGLTDDAVYAAAEVAWRAGWIACRDAEFVGEEAEDEAWGYQGATVAQDIEAKLREKNAPEQKGGAA